jgi:hypothetical protein
MDKNLPAIKSKLSPNANALKRFKKANDFSVFVPSIDDMFSVTHTSLPLFITFVVKTLNFNGLHANKSLLMPSNKPSSPLRF